MKYFRCTLTFRRKVMPLSSGLTCVGPCYYPSSQWARSCPLPCLLLWAAVTILLASCVYSRDDFPPYTVHPEDRGSMFFQMIGIRLQDYTVSEPRRSQSDQSPPWWSRPKVCLAIAQAVGRRLPTAAPRVQSQVRSCGLSGEQSRTGVAFLGVRRFPLLILTPPTALHSLIIILWHARRRPEE
jgi:hypothetical protein